MYLKAVFYTVPWFVELGPDRQVPANAMTITQIAANLCNRQPPLAYPARVNLVYLQTGLGYDLCKYGVRLALELGMVEWCDMPSQLTSMR